MKRTNIPTPEELERQIQKVEAVLEKVKASGVHTEEQFNVLRVMVDVYHDVKRELIKEQPSLERVRELTRQIRIIPDDSGEETDR
jgi:hypothetical protein